MNDYIPMNEHIEKEYVNFVRKFGLERDAVSNTSNIHTNDASFNLFHMSMGLVTEAAEVLDLLKKNMAYERPIDKIKLADELGDLVFYLFGALLDQNLTLEDVINMNMAKLNARYPNGYSHYSANNRDTTVELNAQNEYVNLKKLKNQI